MYLYVGASFLSALLLFHAELIMAKYLLPWFGGVASVWTTCVFFFQILLTLGYLYAHTLATRGHPQTQRTTHTILLAVSLGLLLWQTCAWPAPLLPRLDWRPRGIQWPELRLLVRLAASIGVPFFALSATGPLLQAWFARQHPALSPYSLYAVSNAGSMLGLLSYPFVIEPAASLPGQASGWAAGFALAAVLLAICARRQARCPSARGVIPLSPEGGNTPGNAWRRDRPRRPWRLWLFLAFAPSVLFLATTTVISEEVTIVPFLWILPLSVYLLSFILCFQKRSWYRRGLFVVGGVAALVMVTCVRINRSDFDRLFLLTLVYNFALFVGCMMAHGELAFLKPPPEGLTSYYVTLSLGGMLGGVLAGVVAPTLFNRFWELDIGYFACAVAPVLGGVRDRRSAFRGRHAIAAQWTAWALLSSLVVAIFFSQAYEAQGKYHPAFRFLTRWTPAGRRRDAQLGSAQTITFRRNFYGRLRVVDWTFPSTPHESVRFLFHGRTAHGCQYLAPARRREPTAYYTPGSGIALAVEAARRQAEKEGRSGMRIGVLGLGVGTLAAFGRAGDTLRFYEINPAVVDVAAGPRSLFTFVRDCPGTVDIKQGDGRIILDREPPQAYDLLAVDAFNGDSPPAHLLTREAMAVYLRHLQPNGILVLNISNRYVNFEPVVWGLARAYGLYGALVRVRKKPGIFPSVWFLLSRASNLQEDETLRNSAELAPPVGSLRRLRIWSDDYSSLFPLRRTTKRRP